MVESLPLEAVDENHLVRDRMVQDADEMAALMTSLRARGQQTPIEVVDLPETGKDGARYGLISGWRRLTALRRLHRLYPDEGFTAVQARVIAPGDSQAAYVAMVEENEIRAGLSLYEKGRIALRAVHEGVYPTPRAALQGLFGSISRSRRSKIGSFLTLVEPLDRVLRFPAAIPEKLGLGLAKVVQDDHRFVSNLQLRLRSDAPETAEAELKILTGCLREHTRAAAEAEAKADVSPARPDAPRPVFTGRISSLEPDAVARRLTESRVSARFDSEAGRIELTGEGVDAALFAMLQDWLRARQG